MTHLSEEQLNEYLDHESQQRKEIELHVSSCEECRGRLTALQTLFNELDSLPQQTLSRDLSAAVVRRVGGSGILPTWLTLTIALQAVFAILTLLIAAPFVLEFASVSLPAFQTPSIAELFLQLQTQWMSWQEFISTFQLPVIQVIPTPQFSSLVILSVLAGASMLWLVGNGLLLRNQIK